MYQLAPWHGDEALGTRLYFYLLPSLGTLPFIPDSGFSEAAPGSKLGGNRGKVSSHSTHTVRSRLPLPATLHPHTSLLM